MSALTSTATLPECMTKLDASEQRFLIRGVDWQTYEKFLEAVGERNIRITYDRGCLELMTLSYQHERTRRRLGLLIPILAIELKLDIQGGGSTTFRREDLERGLEPDECFYIANEPHIRGKIVIDLSQDPPPDLAIEIDISRSCLNRMGIYAALGVPELWRFENGTLHVYILNPGRDYELRQQSVSFPFLPLNEVAAFIERTNGLSESGMLGAFRDWIRERILPGWHDSANGGRPQI